MPAPTTYDLVNPAYDQDAVNGLTPVILDRLGEAVDPASAGHVLDAMGGNGNFTAYLLAWCTKRHLRPPTLICLDVSARQCAQARITLADQAQVVWGDLLHLRHLDLDLPLQREAYDRIVVKSGCHELAQQHQPILYRNLSALLKPGGWLVILDVLFECPGQRDEFAAIIHLKDRLAGWDAAVTNRYVVTRQELYPWLRQAGFATIECAMACDYTLRSWVMVDTYFAHDDRQGVLAALQAQQVNARALMQAGRILVDSEGRGCVMRIPAEITVARKPAAAV